MILPWSKLLSETLGFNSGVLDSASPKITKLASEFQVACEDCCASKIMGYTEQTWEGENDPSAN